MTSLRNSIATWEKQSAQYQRDLRNPNLQGPGRDAILRELSASEQMVKNLKEELQSLTAHEIDEKQLKKQYQKLADWFERIEAGSEEEMPYTMKRDLLHFLGLKAYVHKTDERQEIKETWLDVQLELPAFASLVLPSMSPHLRVLDYGQGQPPTTEELEEMREMVKHPEQVSDEEWKEIRNVVEHAQEADGTDATNGHIATRALCA